MRKRLNAIAGIAMLGVLVSSARAATPDEQQVMAVTQAVCDAFRDRDRATLDALLAPDFTLVGTDGASQPRTQAFAEVDAGEPRYTLFRNHDMAAHVEADSAVVDGITSLAGVAGGKPFALDVRFVDTLVRHDGRWRVVESRVTRIAPSSSNATVAPKS